MKRGAGKLWKPGETKAGIVEVTEKGDRFLRSTDGSIMELKGDDFNYRNGTAIIAKKGPKFTSGPETARAMSDDEITQGIVIEKIRTSKLVKSIDGEINKLKTGGVIIGETKKNVARSLNTLKDDILSMGNEITLNDTKNIIQSLDEDINFLINQNDFANARDGASAKVRRSIDQILKETAPPEYRELMKGVAEKTELLSNLNRKFKDAGKVTSRLKNINNPANKELKESVEKLGDIVGVDYKRALSRAEKARARITGPRATQKLKEELPEFANLQRLEKSIESKVYKQKNNIKKIKNQLKRSSEQYSGVRRGATPEKIRLTPNSLANTNKRLFENLSKLGEKDFTQLAKDIATREQFSKTAFQGSRNVGIMTLLGYALTGKVQAAAVVLGGFMDFFGPRIAKGVIDGMVKLNRLPGKIANNSTTLRRIKSLNIPEKSKQVLIDDLKLIGTRKTTEEITNEQQ